VNRWIGIIIIGAAACGGGQPAPATHAPETVRVSVLDRGTGDPALSMRDGDGPWRHLPLVDGAVSFEVTSGVYDLAASCEDLIKLYRATPAELGAIELLRCGEHQTARLDLTVAGVATDRSASAIAAVWPFNVHADGTVELVAFPGITDVVVAETQIQGDERSSGRVAWLRDLDVGGDREVAIDLDREGVATERRTVEIVGADPGERVSVESRLGLAHAGDLGLSVDQSTPYEVDVVPEAELRAEDRRAVFAFGSTGDERRWARGDGSSVTLPPYLGELEASFKLRPTLVHLTWPRDRDASWYLLVLSQSEPEPVTASMLITAGALGDGPTLDYTTPPPSPLLHAWFDPFVSTTLTLDAYHGTPVDPANAIWTAHAGASRSGLIAPYGSKTPTQ
jgi:hypothetical protein